MTANAILYCGIGSQATTQAFGHVTANGAHRGRDSVAKSGTVVHAAGTGHVSAVYRSHLVYGYRVEVTYPVVGGLTFVVGVGHLSRIDVAVGAEVTLSTGLGLSGGKRGAIGAGISTAEHLHEDVLKNGVLVDPELYLANRTAAAGGEGVPIDMTAQEIWALPLNYASGPTVDAAGVRLVTIQTNQGIQTKAILDGQATILAAVRAISIGAPVDDSAIETSLAGIATKLAEIDAELDASKIQDAATKQELLAALAADATDDVLAGLGLMRKS